MRGMLVCVMAAVGVLLVPSLVRATDDLQAQVDALKVALSTVGRQVQLQQLYVEEQSRATGQSGLKLLRSTTTAPRSYHMPQFAGPYSVGNVHDHANNERTMGMGELAVAMNGVDFRTRHNDYRLYQPSATSTEYGAHDHIELPDVPPAVLSQPTLDGQIAELREWLKAFADQDHSVRDYRPYFPPVLCYMEAAWTLSDADTIEESFESDRHFLDATSWEDMLQKVRFCSLTGHKDNLENFAYLPTTISAIDENGQPTVAQWNYRILCHKLSRDLPTSRLHVVDDLMSRMKISPGRVLSLDEYKQKRAARFRVNKVDQAEWVDQADRSFTFLDELMYEIPGMDNYPANLTDEAFGKTALHLNSEEGVLQAGHYHRAYRTGEVGANGLDVLARGYADQTLYMAMNSRPNILPLELYRCNRNGRQCVTDTQRWSYAIPLEVIYLTPLATWNPLDIEHKGDADSVLGATAKYDSDGTRRTGANSAAMAFNGTNSKLFYRTPEALFQRQGDADPADTTRDVVYVLDRQGAVHGVGASGHRISLPAIPDVGRQIRQRYPIMPVHDEGAITWREMEAVKAVVLEPSRYGDYRIDTATAEGEGEGEEAEMETAAPALSPDDLQTLMEQKVAAGEPPLVQMYTRPHNVDGHVHYLTLEPPAVEALVLNATWATATTSFAGGHSHVVAVKRAVKVADDGTIDVRYAIARLDSINDTGGHGRTLHVKAVL